MGTTFPYSKFLFQCHCSRQVDQTPKTPRQPTWAIESFVPMILSSDKLLNLTQLSSLKECLWGKSNLNISDQASFVMWQEMTNQQTTNDGWSRSNWKLFRSYSTGPNSEVAGKPAQAKTQMVEQMQLVSSAVLYQTAEKQLVIKMGASVSKVGKHKLQQICCTCHAYESTQNAGKFVTTGVT